MLANEDINEIKRMLKQLKDEILGELAYQTDHRFRENLETKSDVATAETALCDMDESMDSRMADIENALCELDEEE